MQKECHSQLPMIMGVINVTPDSFSDGGKFIDPNKASKHAQTLIEQGAAIIDLGAASSRPGAENVTPDVEWQRLEPVLKSLDSIKGSSKTLISVDTRNEQTMLKALDYDVDIINNIDGLAREKVLEQLVAKKPNLKYLAMHMHGNPENMQKRPLDEPEATVEVSMFFENSFRQLLKCGFKKENIFLDPGIGFGKTDCANICLLKKIVEWSKMWQIAVGVSRKSFIGRTLDIEDPLERDNPSKMLELGLVFCGTQIVRTHDVAKLFRLLSLAQF